MPNRTIGGPTPIGRDVKETEQPLAALALQQVALEERLFAFQKEFAEYKLTTEKALDVQAKEYERRLEVLNGNHIAQEKLVATMVRQEVYDKSEGLLRIWREKMEKQQVDDNTALQQGYVRKGEYEKSEQDTRSWRAATEKTTVDINLALQRDYLRKEDWNKTDTELQRWKSEVNRTLSEGTGKGAGRTALIAGGIAILGLLFSAGAFLLSLLKAMMTLPTIVHP